MANRSPPKQYQFKKGQSGNPGGKRKEPDDIKEARKLNQNELARILNRCLWMKKEELRDFIKHPNTTMMEVTVASIVAQASQKGDHQRLEFLLQRLIGKVKDQVEVSQKPFIIERRDGTEVVMGHKAEGEES